MEMEGTELRCGRLDSLHGAQQSSAEDGRLTERRPLLPVSCSSRRPMVELQPSVPFRGPLADHVSLCLRHAISCYLRLPQGRFRLHMASNTPTLPRSQATFMWSSKPVGSQLGNSHVSN